MNRHLTDLASVLIGAGAEITAAIYSGNETLSPRCEALKKLIVVRQLNRNWQSKLTELVERVQFDIGPARNRYVHDEWHDGDFGITRIDFRTTLEKPQARQQRRLRTARWHYDEAEKVERLSGEIEIITYQIHIASIILSMHWHEGRPLRPFWRQSGLSRLRKRIRSHNPTGG